MSEMLYKVGDIVQIVDEPNSNKWDEGGTMESDWCGRTMTIVQVLDDGYFMEEDDAEWHWYPEMISGLVTSAETAARQDAQYKVGDRVTIIHTMSGHNWSPDMKVWLGQTMTIARIEDRFSYRMEEDELQWTWNPHMIAGISSSPPPRKYQIGDRVQIVSQRVGGGWNGEGFMDKWLGHIMTIREIGNGHFCMEEDRDDQHKHGGWAWSHHMISGLEEEFMFEPATDDELISLLS
jgi:ribosomal protein L21E